MSDMSNSNSSSCSKRRLSQIDDSIEFLTQEVNTLKNFVYKSEFECSLMTVKMKREKFKALSAVAKSQILLAKMELSIAESDLSKDIERLRNFKRTKLDRNEGESQMNTSSPPQVTPAPTTTTVSVQTHTTHSTEKNKKRNSRHSLRKSLSDISSAETVIIPTVHSSSSLLEAFHTSQTSPELFTNTPANISDSENSLSSSIKAEFNNPYTKTHTQEEPLKKSPTKKLKTDKKVESTSKSKCVSKRTQSQIASIKTVADLRKSVNTASNHVASSCAVSSPMNSRADDKKSTACATYLPVRHNMGVRQTQSRSSTLNPYLHVNPATQANMQHHSPKSGNSQTFSFYGTMQ